MNFVRQTFYLFHEKQWNSFAHTTPSESLLTTIAHNASQIEIQNAVMKGKKSKHSLQLEELYQFVFTTIRLIFSGAPNPLQTLMIKYQNLTADNA